MSEKRKDSKPEETETPVEITKESSPKADELSAREQLMTLWPSQVWEKRG